MAEPECTSTAEPTSAKKRAPPFARSELIFMVEFLERKNYGIGPKGSINSQKATVLQELVKEMEEKFGVLHTERQIQKRYSDLKVRERDTYEGILRKIAREKEKIVQSAPVLDLTTEGIPPAIVPPDSVNQVDILNPEEMITLTLEAIPADPMIEQSTSGVMTANLDDKLSQMESRIVHHFQHVQNILVQKIEELGAILDQRISNLEREMQDFKKKSILMDN